MDPDFLADPDPDAGKKILIQIRTKSPGSETHFTTLLISVVYCSSDTVLSVVAAGPEHDEPLGPVEPYPGLHTGPVLGLPLQQPHQGPPQQGEEGELFGKLCFLRVDICPERE